MYNGMRLHEYNIMRYLTDKYRKSDGYTIGDKKKTVIKGSAVKNLLQEDFGTKDDNDCTLTSLTALAIKALNVMYISDVNVYNMVAAAAEKFGYTAKGGTNPIMISSIMDYLQKQLITYPWYKVKSNYLKSLPIVGFNFDKVKSYIERRNFPLLLNIWKDGRGYYKDHTVLIVGVETYKITDKKGKQKEARFLRVYDNWNKGVSYIDYDLLGISSINYYD